MLTGRSARRRDDGVGDSGFHHGLGKVQESHNDEDGEIGMGRLKTGAEDTCQAEALLAHAGVGANGGRGKYEQADEQRSEEQGDQVYRHAAGNGQGDAEGFLPTRARAEAASSPTP